MKNKGKMVILIITMITMSILTSCVSFNIVKNKTLQKKNNQILQNKNIKSNSTPKKTDFKKVEGITNILLLGADFRDNNDNGRTDAMMILTIDTINNKIKLSSLLRDTLVKISGHGKSKLNHSFSWGGIELLEETIEENFKINIDKYILIDFKGFKKIIDDIGGITVNIKEEELDELNKYIFDIPDENAKKILNAGEHKLNGAQALSYVRIRKNVGGEYGRTQRQRQLLTLVMNKMKDVSVLKYPAILNTIIKNIETNIGFKELLNLGYTINKIDLTKLETIYAPFDEISVGGIYNNHGWVIRTDLEETATLLNEYIFKDKKINLSNLDINNINLIN